jgi:hypothetical protein
MKPSSADNPVTRALIVTVVFTLIAIGYFIWFNNR